MHRIEETVAEDICIGCGACNVATGGAIPIALSPKGMYKADLRGLTGETLRQGSRVCPFSDESQNENELGLPPGSPSTLPTHPIVGPYYRTAAGRVNDEEYLKGSSSGGLTSWVLDQLLKDGHVDAVIHVGRTQGADGPLFEYTVSRNASELRSNRKSQYYSTNFATAMADVLKTDGRYAFVGVPCFIKAARLLCRENEDLGSRIQFFVALICGHLKTQQFAESLAWQTGISPDELSAIDFRVKDPQRSSSDYSISATSRSGQTRVVPRRPLVGSNWGHAAFQPNACNFCDDIFAETADVVFGDAWLPQYEADWRGTNVVVNRNPVIDGILEAGKTSGEIVLDSLSLDDVITTQAGNVRHRRDGLAIRLADDIASGQSVPVKRVAPDRRREALARRTLIRYRRRISAKSGELFYNAKQSRDLAVYLRGMQRMINRYRLIDKANPKKLRSNIRKLLKR